MFCDVITPDDVIYRDCSFCSTSADTGSPDPDQQSNLSGPKQCTRYPACARESGHRVTASVLREFLHKINNDAKVDLSTFTKIRECDVFANDYLQPIDIPAEDRKRECDVADDTSETDDTFNNNRKSVPYTYRAIVAAGIYTSGKATLSVTEIVEEMKKMFPKMNFTGGLLNKRVRRVLCKHDLFYTVPASVPRQYGVLSKYVTSSIFTRVSVKGMDVSGYKLNLADHLNLPNMVTELAAGRRHLRTSSIEGKTLTTSCKRPLETEGCSPKFSCLEMPDRPCFTDDSGCADDDELFLSLCETSRSTGSLESPDRAEVNAPNIRHHDFRFQQTETINSSCYGNGTLHIARLVLNGQAFLVPVQL